MSGPFDAPEGTAPQTYLVTIQAVVPWVHTDPACWDFEALMDWVTHCDSSEVTSAIMRPNAESVDVQVSELLKAIETIKRIGASWGEE